MHGRFLTFAYFRFSILNILTFQMFTVGKSFFSKILSKFNIQTIAPLCFIHIPQKMLAAYCYEVNQQAKLGGMASSVAKINSVGLRLALKELSSSATLPALAQSLWSWEDLDCDVMFPSCDLGLTKVEKS